MTERIGVRGQLGHVRWIGGGSGAGKSVVSRRLAAGHALDLYATDDVMASHARRLSADDAPLLADFLAMDMDQRWLRRDPVTMLETFHWFRGEGFDLIADDLRQFEPSRSVIAEGLRLLPHLVAPLLTEPHHAVWLLPTPAFRLAAFERRGSLWTIAAQTSDPQSALRNLLERDRLFTEWLSGELERLHLRSIDVDVSMTEDDLAELVERSLAL